VAVLVSGMAAGDDGTAASPRVLRYARVRACAGNDGRVPSTGNDHRHADIHGMALFHRNINWFTLMLLWKIA